MIRWRWKLRLWRLAGLVASAALVAGCGRTTDPADGPAPEAKATALAAQTKPADDAAPAETEVAAAPAKPGKSRPAAASAKGAKKDETTGDWIMWGGDMHRNMANATTNIDLDIEPALKAEDGKNLLWVVPAGSQTYGNPVVADGKVYVGANNGAGYRPQHPATEDRGVMLCFNEKDGKFLWQLTRRKLEAGRVNDWPEQGICSTPCVEGKRLYVVTNRAELMCVDTEGFADGENDGPFMDEEDTEEQDADIIWSYNMVDDLGVFPHNLATSSPVIFEDAVYIVTSNGVAEDHLEVPAPRAPSFAAFNKETGELLWEDAAPSLDSAAPEPFNTILHGQWSSPAIVKVKDKPLVLMPGGDGWLYALDAKTGEHVWKFDLNPKDSVWELGGRGTRNNIISTPVVYENSVILAVGQDPEHGEGVGHIYRIDATKTGDVSPVIADGEGGWKENPDSAQIWHHGGEDDDGSVTGSKGRLIFRRTISTVSVDKENGVVYAPDLSGYVHCLDLETGKRYWEHDMLAACWGSPMLADGRVLIGDEDGDLTILKAGKELQVENEIPFNGSIYSTPTIANGRLYITDRSRLYAFKLK